MAVLAAAAPAFAATPDALVRLWLAGPARAYQGRQTATVFTEAGPVVSSVVVRGDGKGATLREYTSGAAKGAAVLQTRTGSWTRSVAGAWTRLPGTPKPDTAARAARLLSNYRVTAGAPVRIAGRSAVPLSITARRPWNPSRRVWLDAASGLALKEEALAPGGRVRSSSVFTSVAYAPQTAALFRPPSSVSLPPGYGPPTFQPMPSREAAEKRAGRPAPAPAHIPEGYVVETYGIMATRRGDWMPAVRYSDGLAAFTIFRRHSAQERGRGGGRGGPGFRGGRGAGGPGPNAGRNWRVHQMQSTLQQSVVSLDTAGASYLLVGDLAESELRRVADSLP
jgi:hypothetical protein